METGTIIEVIEIIRQVKSLFVEQNPYLPMFAALGGAFIGAVATVIPSLILNWQNTRKERKSAALQIYAEVKSYLEVIEARQYLMHLEQIVQGFLANSYSTYSYRVQVNDERFIIYKNCIGKLGLLRPTSQIKIVEFYQLLEAIIQDVKLGGLLNSGSANLYAYKQALSMARKIVELGHEITQELAKDYNIK